LEVILVSHNLNLEGAPLFGCEYALHLAALPGWRVRIAAAQDGPLRRRFEDAGLPVEIVPVEPLLAARTPADFDRALDVLATSLDWTRADLIVANTMVAFWAVHCARHLRKPALLYIHESAPVWRFFGPQLAPALIGRVEEAFGLASRVVFIAAATLAVHARLERRGNFRLLPSWIDTAGIDRFATAHDPLVLRRQRGLTADAIIFANVGSVCERKGQHVFVRAIERLERDLAIGGRALPPRQYLMVGARAGDYLDSLRQEIALRRLTNVVLVGETAEPNAFYRASDIFVCSSFEESFPRVLMEAAAFRLPIVSTNVDGVAELLDADDAWLVPPGDAALLAVAMRAALDAHLAGDRSRAERAARVVAGKFSAERNLPLHAALAVDAADHGRR
jgi:glycosyltransferase involved in cell wall biosynthesis